jgi:hypothetical protein
MCTVWKNLLNIVAGSHPLVMSKEVFDADFADYDKIFNKIYEPLPGPGVKKWQIFSCSIDNKNTDVNDNNYGYDNNIENSPNLLLFYFRASNLWDAKVSQVIIQNAWYEERDNIRIETLGLIAKPKIRVIKEWELFKHYCPYVPKQYHAKLCPELDKKAIDELKTERENKEKNQTTKTKSGRLNG